MLFNNIKWLFFDLGYTLINEDEAHIKHINDCIEYQKAHNNRLFTYDEIYNEMCRASAEYRQQFYGAMETLKIIEKTAYPKDYEKPYPNTKSVLSKLSEKYKIGIIANQSAGTKNRLSQFGMLSFIDLCIASYEAGIEKPDKRIFQLALNQADCSANEAVMIGDRLDNDIYPANKLGMKTIHIKQGFGAYQEPKNNDYKADLTINGLSELLLYL